MVGWFQAPSFLEFLIKLAKMTSAFKKNFEERLANFFIKGTLGVGIFVVEATQGQRLP